MKGISLEPYLPIATSMPTALPFPTAIEAIVAVCAFRHTREQFFSKEASRDNGGITLDSMQPYDVFRHTSPSVVQLR
jgi:hypothetical protein